MPLDTAYIKRQNNIEPNEDEKRRSRDRLSETERREEFELDDDEFRAVAVYDLSRIDTSRYLRISPAQVFPDQPSDNPIIITITQVTEDIAAAAADARTIRLVFGLTQILAQRFCPVDTGLLRSSLVVFPGTSGNLDENQGTEYNYDAQNYIFIGSSVHYFRYNLDFTDTVRRLLRKSEKFYLRGSIAWILRALGLA